MKRMFFLSMAAFLFVVGMSAGQESELHGSVGVTYSSKYVWRGFDVYGDKSAIHPFIDLDFFGTGFGMNITGHRANSDGFENSERWDYNVYYGNKLFAGERYETLYRFGYVYYNYPDMSSHTTASIDLQELHGIFTWPKILPVKGLVPTYILVKLWPTNSGTIVGANSPSTGTASGFAHIFMLDYGMDITCPITNENRVLNWHSELVFNDGVAPNGANADHDWSNAVFGVSTDFEMRENLVFTPGIFHQITMDDSVNPDKDETWASLTLRYNF